LQLSAGDIHVFRIPLDNPTAVPEECLDPIERDRAARFVFERDRRRFIGAHAATRAILGGFLGRRPAAIRFGIGAHGKPYVHEPGLDLRFNLSHSGERALLAVSHGREVGVDVEEIRTVDWLPLAHRFFAVREVADLKAMPATERVDAFFRCWTRKEAFLKAHGKGLYAPLNAFQVDLTANDGPQLLSACYQTPAMREHWRIVSLAIDAGYVAALAAEAGDWRICYSDATGS
jgi:4'-phosphopantetheinyl transferase